MWDNGRWNGNRRKGGGARRESKQRRTQRKAQCFRRARADMTTITMKRTAATKDVTTAPLVRSQKSSNCRQMGTQLALWFPLWARYTIAAAEAAAAVVSATMTCVGDGKTVK